MRSRFEIVNRLMNFVSANELVYSPLDSAPLYRRTRVYDIDYSGSSEGLRHFVRGVLTDEIVEEIMEDGRPTAAEGTAALDVFLKPGVLDLEKEYILRYANGARPANLEIHDLAIIQRYYIQHPCEEADIRRIVGDLVNPVIQDWSICLPPCLPAGRAGGRSDA